MTSTLHNLRGYVQPVSLPISNAVPHTGTEEQLKGVLLNSKCNAKHRDKDKKKDSWKILTSSADRRTINFFSLKRR